MTAAPSLHVHGHADIGIALAALGWLNPMIAWAAMALSSLSVIVNSSLLRGCRAS